MLLFLFALAKTLDYVQTVIKVIKMGKNRKNIHPWNETWKTLKELDKSESPQYSIFKLFFARCKHTSIRPQRILIINNKSF